MPKTSARGEQLIKSFEGLELTPYIDAVGILTVGYGHTSDAFYKVVPGKRITKAFAEKLFDHDLEEAEAVLDRLIAGTPLNSNQYGAVISLMFNIGNQAFAKSTLCRLLRKGDLKGASKQFAVWRKARDPKTGKLVVLNGLSRRRAAETELFNTPDYLGSKPVVAPKIKGASDETKEAREAKGAVASDKPGLLSKFLAPLGAIGAGATGVSAQDGFDIVDRARESFYGAPLWVWGVGLIAIVGLVIWNKHRAVD